MPAFGQLLVVIELVKGFDGQGIEYKLRQIKGHGQRQMLLERLTGQRGILTMVATHKNTATERISADEQVYPRNGVLKILVSFGGKLKKFVQRGKTNSVGINIGVDNTLELELSPENQPGQAQPAN